MTILTDQHSTLTVGEYGRTPEPIDYGRFFDELHTHGGQKRQRIAESDPLLSLLADLDDPSESTPDGGAFGELLEAVNTLDDRTPKVEHVILRESSGVLLYAEAG
ncbi:hypothetical protein H9Y04_41355 [Streptomyces sp. TRM66268-LWL]|uniref:Halobacterial output domain-containing protein n=1 Tax=Streptomyces polyasparticus TaxID=2767826 RepID=A0ABR7SVU1_9ACTN|nr:hypothetical protein [Streptomyces polyasparticus]MBC9718994.1 hypothetical protein [Streptomyces polyasparticus]